MTAVRFPLEYPVRSQISPLVKRSSCKNLGIPIATDISQKVRFATAPNVQVFDYDHTPAEKQACWYSPAEYNAMKRDAVDVISRKMRGQPVKCFLGLECRTIQEQQARTALISDTRTAVTFGKTPEFKAKAYQVAGATQAAKAAALRGLMLASALEKKRIKSDATIRLAPPTATGRVVTIQSTSKRLNRVVPMIRI